MGHRLEYFFDYVSPFTYLADTQLQSLSDTTGAEVVYRPMLLGGVMKSAGNTPPMGVAAKGKYMFADLQRWADRYGVPLQMNPHFPLNTVTAMRAALVCQQRGEFETYHQAMFRAAWCGSANLADREVLAGLIARAGLDAAAILARAGEDDIKDALKKNTAEAVARGTFGAPTFFVGEEMFFGNDRLDFVEAALGA